jgi:hypothetical protein
MEFHDANSLAAHCVLVESPGWNNRKTIGSCLFKIAHPVNPSGSRIECFPISNFGRLVSTPSRLVSLRAWLGIAI